jgi:hypothetical protein
MSFFSYLTDTKLGRWNLLTWAIIVTIFILILGLILWLDYEAKKPPPEIVVGQGKGIFHGKRYIWKAAATRPPEYADNSRCFADSYILFYGELTYSDGTIEDVSLDGRKIEGIICADWIENRIWMSSDKSHETPIEFHFEGTVYPMPFMDWGALTYPFIIVCLIGVIVYLLVRKTRRKDYDALSAKKRFKEYLDDEGLRGEGRIMAKKSDLLSGQGYVVAQQINARPVKYTLLLDIDNKGRIQEDMFDFNGDKTRERFGKDALRFSRELAKEDRQDTQRLYEDFKQRFDEGQKERKKTPKTTEEKTGFIEDIKTKEGDMWDE